MRTVLHNFTHFIRGKRMAPSGVSYGKGLFYELFRRMVYTNGYCLVHVSALGALATATGAVAIAILSTRGNPLVRSAEFT